MRSPTTTWHRPAPGEGEGQGWEEDVLVSELGVHHDTVRRALTLERVSGTGVKSVRPTLLDDYKDFIQATLVLPSTLDEGKEGQNERAG